MLYFRFILFFGGGVLVESVYVLYFSKNTLFFLNGAFLQHPFTHCVLNIPL